MITRSVTKEAQCIKCNHRLYRSKVLEISENVLKLIPPRPAGMIITEIYLIVEPVFHLIRLQQPKPRQIFHCPFYLILIV
jgi:hypothetical protein